MHSSFLKPGILMAMLVVATCCVKAQTDTAELELSLSEVVSLARERSIEARQASTLKETKYWEWRVYRSNYQPQLMLSGVLPAYSKTFSQVVQPDGTVQFQPIHNNN